MPIWEAFLDARARLIHALLATQHSTPDQISQLLRCNGEDVLRIAYAMGYGRERRPDAKDNESSCAHPATYAYRRRDGRAWRCVTCDADLRAAV